jgi:cytochrome c oxidase cbb3-type subunit IV
VSELYGLIRSLWLLWIVLLFAGIVAWVFWPSRKREMEAHGQIPFKDEGER